MAEVPNPLSGSSAVFPWGPRQTGKTTPLERRYPEAQRYDLLDTDTTASLAVRPRLLREEVLAARPPLVLIDEVQQVPAVIEEVHRLLEHTATREPQISRAVLHARIDGRCPVDERDVYFLVPPVP